MAQDKLILDRVYEHEAAHGDALYMTQPVGSALHTYTWAQTMDQARRMASYLKAQKFEPGARIAILSKNCPQFIMAELAIWMAGGTTVAIFPTETADTIRFVLEHSEARLLFVGRLDTWEQQQAGIPAGLPCVALPYAPPQADFPTWDALVAAQKPIKGRPARAASDLALIAYTSGSTGQPKGVMHSFHSLTAGAGGIGKYFRKSFKPTEGLRMLSYLPMAHALERVAVVGFSLIDGHVQVFFADTLETFVQDLNRARPSIFISVPRLWLKFQLGVFAKMPPKKLDRFTSLPILGKVVKRKVLAGLGLDHVKVAFSGSAPIPAELIAWYKKLGLNLLEAYGMTEDLALSHVSTLERNAPGYVGVPHDGVEVRISDEGEVLVKSPARLVGYYKRPDLDAESFTEDGFFRTGDKGERRSDGLLKITGRVKELFKTAKGKYVSPAPIENKINASPLIELSLVSGVGKPSAYAMVMLAENLRPKQNDAAFRAATEPQMVALLDSVNSTLPDYEKLQMLVVVQKPWTIESGLLTPTMKVKRSRIEDAAEPAVDAWYAAKGSKVIWATA
jgi:long-subunit acyl-CoA synthetase (AMP-forming)